MALNARLIASHGCNDSWGQVNASMLRSARTGPTSFNGREGYTKVLHIEEALLMFSLHCSELC